ncbi:MAG: threonine/serine exporter family protein [Bilifractor sp.]
MKQTIIQLIAGAFGSAGYALVFHLRRRYIPLVMIGGVIGWGCYLLAAAHFHGIFLPTLIAGFATDLYAEILARVCKAPSTPFFITSAIPLIPGGTLYYCMDAIVRNDLDKAGYYGQTTLFYALGIAAGMAIAWSLCDFQRKMAQIHTAKTNPQS